MKDGKIIKIRTEKLMKIRNNLRRILYIAIDKEYENLNDKKMKLKRNSAIKHDEIYTINQQQIKLLNKRNSSILMCSSSDCKGLSEVDMVYDAEFNEWYCEMCYAIIKEKRDPQNLFNRGIIVHEDVEKPCHQLRWCPYGAYVERFMIRLGRPKPKSSCLVFGHDCPVFYISEKVSEDSPKRPPLIEKFTERQDWLEFFPSDEFFNPEFEKPCYELDWCPYGPVAELSKKPTEQNHYVCKVFKKICPSYYLSEGIAESKKMQKIFGQD